MAKRAGLVLAGLVAIATPLIPGITHATELRAQTQAAPKQDISGTWQGKVSSRQAPNGEMRLVFKISKADGGALSALLYAIDRDPAPFSATRVTLKGSTLQISIQLLQSVFEGTLGRDGNTIAGKWTQDANTVPLNLVRATDQTAWAIPELPPPPVRMPANGNPEFAVATIKPSRPGATRGGYGIRGQDVTTTNVTVSWMIKGLQRPREPNIGGASVA